MRFLVLTLRGAMMSFGGAVIDGAGNTGRLPRLSALAGLLANALGYDRTEAGKLADLQDAIVFAAREDIPGHLETDFQTAQLSKGDTGWTRFGLEKRGGSLDTYDNPIIRNRPFLADHGVTVVIGLNGRAPSIDDLAQAFLAPLRPLFLGRKSFPPSIPMIGGARPVFVEAPDAFEALSLVPPMEHGKSVDLLACWPDDCAGGNRVEQIDIRDFIGNRHAGSRMQREGRISVKAA